MIHIRKVVRLFVRVFPWTEKIIHVLLYEIKKSRIFGHDSETKLFGWMDSISPFEWRNLRKKLPDQLDNLHFTNGLSADIKQQKNLISVISSLYKSDRYLSAFITDLRNQTIFQNAEIYLVSVCPTNYQRETLNDFAQAHTNVQVIHEDKNINLYEAWNIAIANTSSPLICNWNDDDRHGPVYLERIFEAAKTNADKQIFFPEFYISYDSSASYEVCRTIGAKSKLMEVTLKTLLFDNSTPHASPAWRRKIHDTVGVFDASFPIASDRDFWINCAANNFKFEKIDEPLYAYFVNPKGLSTSGTPAEIDWERVQDKWSHLRK